ncbi:hypothetical protein GALMADRAFT_245037 [Galerina marginata CBS 339.88]|uniref:Major facilitator superfamily (MFS) profile domain-containing protein n=1 Tax=Galerina marginata (strain CBS 339.88) TaxID=685588 RepID=A0A067TDU1_GALM3|nr:hypothetical protein GALMADRAFT_245037 [Galerina marginata CBS 339.88]
MADANPQRNPSRSPTRSVPLQRRRFSPLILVIPLATIYRFAIILPTTTSFRIIQLVACQVWYHWNDPSTIPTPESCSTPGVDRYYSAIISILAIGDGIGGIFGCAVVSFLSSRFGRKPVLLGLIFIGVLSHFSILTSQLLEGWKQVVMFAVWAAFELTGSSLATIFAINLYILDFAQAEERSIALSRIAGWSYLGSALALLLGGSITVHTQATIAVYITSLTILGSLLLYTMVAVPESFPASKREQLRRERAATAPSSQPLIQRLKSSTAFVSEPLQLFKPHYNPLTGRRNWRLVYCAIHIFIVGVADGYAVLAMVLYFITYYKYTPAQTGYVLTIVHITNVVVLTVLVPLVLRFLKPLYARNEPFSISGLDTPAGEDGNHIGTINEDGPSEAVSRTSDHLDVHLTIVSWAIESLAYIGVGAATTLATQLVAVICIGFGAGRAPVFRSLVAASVNPLKQGEALASTEMVSNLASMLSPILMGNIMTLTITSAPQTIFYVHAVIIAAGAAVLFLVKDEDRYQKPAIFLESED